MKYLIIIGCLLSLCGCFRIETTMSQETFDDIHSIIGEDKVILLDSGLYFRIVDYDKGIVKFGKYAKSYENISQLKGDMILGVARNNTELDWL